MLEIEMKFPIRDVAAFESRLAQAGAKRMSERQDVDHYFNAPDRDFARTDEALRLRRIGQANFVTYKGPKQDAQTKTRTEIEVPLAEGAAFAEDFARLLTHLGYRSVAVVQKQRRIYHLQRGTFPVEVCVDEVQDLGRFVELEILAPEEQLADARRIVQELATALGLSTSERRSYLELLLEARPLTLPSPPWGRGWNR
jgi:adenylate cyclase class 2